MPFYVRGTKLYPYHIRYRSLYRYGDEILNGHHTYSYHEYFVKLRIRKIAKKLIHYYGYQVLYICRDRAVVCHTVVRS